MQSLTINRPDDWHVHFRDGSVLSQTVAATAKDFSRALVMPNLKPPLTTLDSIIQYRKRILEVLPESYSSFQPFMTFYLNESVNEEELFRAAKMEYILGGKLYPAGATTHSEAGAKSLKAVYPLFEVMQSQNLVLQIHGETTSGDIFAREALFVKEHLPLLIKNFPKLRIVLEHISSREAVDFILESSNNIAATITPHHLLYNRNKLLVSGIKPHYYCLPILKHERHQKAVAKAALSGNPKFFAGTDSAPHALKDKQSACGCAGIFSAAYALPLYTQFFNNHHEVEKLNAFTGIFGAEFYQLPANKEEVELIEIPQKIPEYIEYGEDRVVPIAAGETISWSVYEPS